MKDNILSTNSYIEQLIKSGVASGNYNMIIGKPRQMGRSYYNMKYLNWFRAQKRKESIKRFLNTSSLE